MAWITKTQGQIIMRHNTESVSSKDYIDVPLNLGFLYTK
tara:strand:- start:5922 stop:6038 length:117 start_codon:yes stop_codon:yes gene_type:complete